MPISIWIWLGGIIGAILAGSCLIAIGFFIASWIGNKKQTKNIPKNKEEIKQWLKRDDVAKVMAYPGKNTSIDIKEVEEDERTKFGKFREFERLKRLEQGKPDLTIKAEYYQSSFGQSERGSISDKPIGRDAEPKAGTKRSVSFD